MKKSRSYGLLVLSIIILLFSVSALGSQCSKEAPDTIVIETAEAPDTTVTETAEAPDTTVTEPTEASDTTVTEPAETPNQNPVINDIELPSETIKENQQYDIFVNASDPDADTLTYKWAVGGGTIKDDTTNPMTWVAPNMAGIYTIEVNVTDGKGGETTLSRTVSVEEKVEIINLEGGFEDSPKSLTMKIDMGTGKVTGTLNFTAVVEGTDMAASGNLSGNIKTDTLAITGTGNGTYKVKGPEGTEVVDKFTCTFSGDLNTDHNNASGPMDISYSWFGMSLSYTKSWFASK
ncbi:MAG: PKD domain-containing protein [Actinobacteria bacterium]|nr:PKD domain-containing protein [Actinomycetota bacterium]